MSYLFALCTETKLISASELYRLCKPLEQNARHCAEAWGLEAPAVIPFDDHKRVPKHASPIVFTDDDTDPGALAVHYFDPLRGGPAAAVYVERASGLNVGRESVCEAAAHEVTESIVNPRVNLWLPHPSPDRFGVQVARECADPTQDTYDVVVDGMRWQVANFIKPAWFDPAAVIDADVRRRVMNGGGFDHARRLTHAGEIGPEGYAIMRERVDGVWQLWFENGIGDRFGSAPPKNAIRDKRKAAPTARGSLLRGTA